MLVNYKLLQIYVDVQAILVAHLKMLRTQLPSQDSQLSNLPTYPRERNLRDG